jgi:hypothetical protein
MGVSTLSYSVYLHHNLYVEQGTFIAFVLLSTIISGTHRNLATLRLKTYWTYLTLISCNAELFSFFVNYKETFSFLNGPSGQIRWVQVERPRSGHSSLWVLNFLFHLEFINGVKSSKSLLHKCI